MSDPTIIYTHTDEAPALATYSLLPIVRAYAAKAGSQAGDARHLAGRAHHRQLSRAPRSQTSASATRSPSWASWPRRPKPTSSSCPTSPPPSPSSRRPSPSCSSRATPSPTIRRSRESDAEREVLQALRPRQGQRGQPGAARGQLRSSRARIRQELRARASASHGRLVVRFEDQRGAHGRR